jgi:hypothetical protein
MSDGRNTPPPEESREESPAPSSPSHSFIVAFQIYIPLETLEQRPMMFRGLRPLHQRRHTQLIETLLRNAHMFASFAAEV